MKQIAKAPNCAHCTKPAALVTGRDVYPHRADLAGKRFWKCAACDAWVGVHRDARNFAPLGSPANTALREMRRQCHDLFDPLWQRGKMTRQEAYAWLAGKLGIEQQHCHIGHFRFDRARMAIEALQYRREIGDELADMQDKALADAAKARAA